MPSLFSRARTTSTPHKKALAHSDGYSPASLDEFGRTQSRNSNRAPTPSKKDKKKAKDLAKRAKTLGSRLDALDVDLDQPPALPDGSFLPLSLEPPKNDTAAGEQARETDYGYLSYERHVVLGLEQLEALVSVVVEELETRGGITTPFIFSTTALDISASAIKRLIRSFLNMCSGQGREAERAWREEAKFAGPHELGMCLRWGLARVVRVSGGIDVRGLISWDIYLRFRDSEAANGYPPGLFEAFLDELEPTLQVIVVRVLTLLTRLTANSTSSGHTPPTLSPLFGPLLFGLGPATLAFHHTYIHYLRAVNATEHLVLAFIRWQDTPRFTASSSSNASGSAAALGVPIRLKEWIKGYPAMLPFLHEHKNVKPQPRKGAKTVTVTTVRRNVRMYSPDLVKSAATWAHRSKSSNGVVNGLASSKEWERIAPATLKLPPRYSETYKKRMNLPPGFHPEIAPSRSNNASAPSAHTPTLASTLAIGTGTQPADKDYFGLGKREGEDRFRSLTDLKWGEFESMGFSTLGDEKKLQFDLTESAREARTAKRQTMSWNDFSAAGFSRGDAPLKDTLQFSTPLTLSVTNWPTKDAELTKKLKKTEKELPPFGWDTVPVMGNEEIIEESFVDVFCDLVYGGGWMDLERGEYLDRDVNWALVEFKSLPPNKGTVAGGSDPRTNGTLILFEEFVPFEYRQQLSIKSTTRRRLPALFSPSKSKQWKQAPTLNGRPYVVGHVPRSPSYREMEFEGLLQGGSGTKVISLGSKASTRVVSTASTNATAHENALDMPKMPPPPVPPLPSQPSSSFSPQGGITNTPSNAPSTNIPPQSTSTQSPHPLPRLAPPPQTPKAPRSDELHSTTTSESTSTMSPSAKKSTSRFRITNVISVPSPKRMSQILTPGPVLPGIPPADYSAVDFETTERRLASYSGSERDDDLPENNAARRKKAKKRESKDDSWVDILVNSQSRRMVGQDVDPSAITTTAAAHPHLLPSIGDPDIASLEVAQVLAAVRGHRHERSLSRSLGSLSSTDDDGVGVVGGFDRHAREHGPSIDMDAHVEGLEIDEVERVPRRLRGSVDESESSAGHGVSGGGGSSGLAYDDGEEYAADDEEHSQDFSHSNSHSHHLDSSEVPVTPQRHQRAQVLLPEPPVEQGEQVPPSLATRHALKQQRRLGYFDMHPERKKLYSSPGEGYSPEEDDDDDDFPYLQPPPPPQQLGVRASAASASTQFGGGSASPDVPSFDSSIEKKRAEMERSGLTRADSVTLPPSLPSLSGSKSFESGTSAQTNGHAAATTTATTPVTTATTNTAPPIAHPIGPRAPAGAAGAGTKTAALIEMYRERERRAQVSPPAATTPTTATTPPVVTTPPSTTPPPAVPLPGLLAPQPLAPLRLPTRTASLPGATNPNANISTPPSTTPEPVVNAPPPPPDVVVEPPSRVGLAFEIDESGGRASPARYVHGAPLHNVIEEEEEE